MGILESFDKLEKAKTNTESEAPKEIKGSSVKEILKNDSQDFGAYLDEEGQEELGQKILNGGELSMEENRILAEQRKGYLEVLERAKTISTTLDASAIQQLIESNPDLKAIVDVNGNEGIREVIKRFLPRLAITDRERFIALEENIKLTQETKESRGKDLKAMEQYMRDYNLNSEEYAKFMQGEPDPEIMKHVISKTREKLTTWGKITTRAKTTRKEIEALAGANAEKLRDYQAKLREQMQDLGDVLQSTLIENPVLHKALAEDLRGNKLEKEAPDTKFQELNEAPDEADVKKKWDAWQIEHGDELMEAGTTREDAIRRFSQEYAKGKGAGKKGFWAQFWGPTFSPKVEKILTA